MYYNILYYTRGPWPKVKISKKVFVKSIVKIINYLLNVAILIFFKTKIKDNIIILLG